MSAGEEAAGHNRCPSNNRRLISNLPPELFVQILENVYWLLRRPGIIWDTNWTVTYQRVCRRWRDVICSTPQLWQQISVNSSPKYLEFCLMRCADALATVHVWHPTSPEATFATLCRHASAIRACYVHSDVPYISYLLGLPPLLATPMPALETLSLDGPYRVDEIADVPITHDLVPRLTTLTLRNCTAPCDTAVYTSLRSLALLGSPWKISYHEFLDILGKCRDLEYLSLDEEIIVPFAEQLANPTTGHPPRTTPVVLPRLRSVKLSGQPKALFHLLATVHAPQATRIELGTSCLHDVQSGALVTVTRLLPPNVQLRYPFLSSPRAASLSCWYRDPFKVSLRCGPDRNALFCVDYGMVHNELRPGTAHLEHNLVAIMDLFSLASVDTLEVKGRLDQVAVETWQRVFTTFSNLRTLHLKGRGTLDTLWLGLSRASASALEQRGVVCCPLLSEIAIDDRPRVASRFNFAATTALFDTVRGVLRARADAGGTRLQKLQLYLQYTNEVWSQTSGLREAFLEDVKTLVGELDYRHSRLYYGPF